MLFSSYSLIWTALSLMYISSTFYIQLLLRDSTDYIVRHLTVFDPDVTSKSPAVFPTIEVGPSQSLKINYLHNERLVSNYGGLETFHNESLVTNISLPDTCYQYNPQDKKISYKMLKEDEKIATTIPPPEESFPVSTCEKTMYYGITGNCKGQITFATVMWMILILIVYVGTSHLREKPEEADLVIKEHKIIHENNKEMPMDIDERFLSEESVEAMMRITHKMSEVPSVSRKIELSPLILNSSYNCKKSVDHFYVGNQPRKKPI